MYRAHNHVFPFGCVTLFSTWQWLVCFHYRYVSLSVSGFGKGITEIPLVVPAVCCARLRVLFQIMKGVASSMPRRLVVIRSNTSCPVQRIPFHACNLHESQTVLKPEVLRDAFYSYVCH